MSSHHATGGSGSGGFPLRANFFRSLPLTDDKKVALYHDAKANAIACLNQSFNDQWRYVPPEKDGTQLRKDTSNLASSYRLIRAATVLRCQEHEVNQVISNTNTESWREFMRKCFGKQYVDTMILHHVPVPSTTDEDESENQRAMRAGSEPEKAFQPQNNNQDDEETRSSLWKKSASCMNLREEHGHTTSSPGISGASSLPPTTAVAGRSSEASSHYSAATAPGNNQDDLSDEYEPVEEILTVKWGAFDSGMSGKRDVCLVDYLSSAIIPNTDHERVNLWCFTSADGDRIGCMELKDTHNVTRTKLTKLGVFWRAISEEETEVIICGSFPSKHAKVISSTLLACLSKLQSIVEDLRLSNQIYIHRSTWVKDSERSNCHLCMRNFHALRRKHHCRKCGEVICSDCSLVENVDLPVIGYSKLRLCKVCCVKAKSTPLKRMEKSNVFDHLVRARSLSNVPTASRAQCGPEPAFKDTMMTADTSEHSSSSFSSSSNNNNNNQSNDLVDFEEYRAAPAASSRLPHPEDFDDFIDNRLLKSQLTAMHEQQQQQKAAGRGPSNSNMFDLLCELACQTLNCPIASVSIVDAESEGRQCIRSATGLDENPALDGELQLFIDKIMGSTPAIVLDANVDKQVQQLFTKRAPPTIRFFAGCPIYSSAGKKLGYVCVADTTKRDTLGASCAFTMERLASLAVTTMERNAAAAKSQNTTTNNNTTHGYEASHPAMLFDRPHARSSGTTSSYDTPSSVNRVYEVQDDDIPMMVGSPIYTTMPTQQHHHQQSQYAMAAPPPPPPARSHSSPQEYSAGYYEAQERMRKLLLKSYHTQQQLASGGTPPPSSHY